LAAQRQRRKWRTFKCRARTGTTAIWQFALPVSQRESEVPRRWTADEPYNQTVQTVVSNVLFGELS
jgi:hypothetical protein